MIWIRQSEFEARDATIVSYLIILVVVALAIAPLLHFVPSKRQRRVARLREHAALSGLFVEFRDLPQGVGAVTAGRSGNTIYYGRRLPPPRRGEARSGLWAPGADGWRAVGQRQPVPVPLGELPASAQAAGLDNSSCGVYWQEAGDEHDIDRIKAVLESWASGL
jgi:hypothetical protein